MRSNFKIKVIVIGIGGILIFLSALSIINPYFKTKIDENIKSSDSAVSGVIHIDNNWTEAEIMGICTGEGTYSNPYVIQDLVINGSGFGACILIENTDEYFRIENCTVFNSGEVSYGINLNNVNNSQIINNTLSTYQDGIILFYSNNNTISVNIANSITNSDGIYLSNSDNNIISKNIINNSGNSGIKLSQSNDNFISENKATFNNYFGIDLDNSDNNIVSGNIVNKSNYGILLSYSFKNNILRNDANNNSCGIRLDNSYYNVISENDGEYNYNGIFLFKSVENLISGNTLKSNLMGMGIFYSDNNIISENIVNNNNYNGIELSNSNNNSIKRNSINNNNECGLYLFDSDFNIISGNKFLGNEICIKEVACKRNLFFNNGSCTYRDVLILIILLFSIIGLAVVIGILTNSLVKRTRKVSL